MKDQEMSRLMAVTEKKNSNSGFSLVELIIVVSILAIAAVPLMKSLGMASKTNAKAQSIQNATSLGESIMEEMKSTPIDVIMSDHGASFDASGIMTFTLNGQTATQGETFDVTVTIDKSKYSGSDTFDDAGTGDAKKANVGSANTIKIPKIEDIDSQSQAVLSKKELNKYDVEALNYFNQKLPNYDPAATPPIIATIASKTINIEKRNISGSDYGVTVKATVTYTDGAGNPYVRDLYTGTFVQQVRDGSTEKKRLDSNIFIFYTMGSAPTVGNIRETFIIDDQSNVTTFEAYDATRPTDCHKVYFIRQDVHDTTGPLGISFAGSSETFDFTKAGDLTGGRKMYTTSYGTVELITNLTSSLVSSGHIYEDEARTRVYDIKVKIYKGSDLVTTLNSTITASDD